MNIKFAAIALAFVISILPLLCFSQLSQAGQPYSFSKSMSRDKIPTVKMKAVDMSAIRREDKVNDKMSGKPFRFGVEQTVNLNLKNAGAWNTLPNGDRLWRLVIEDADAKSINLVYDEFYLPQDASLYLYSENYQQILGAFTARNNKPDGSFATALTTGDKVYLEYYEPAAVKGKGAIQIKTVVHGYRSVFTKSNNDLGFSGGCNVDTECPEGDAWREQLKSVGKTISGGSLCSGTLVANTSGDRRPLFLTANHCGFSNTVVVYWRFERPQCGSGTPDDTQTTSGATIIADVDGNPGGAIRSSDHLLLELLENPADAYDVYFAGWDASGATPQGVTGIHHPAGDAKKISMDSDLLTSTDYLDPAVDPNESHWRVADWDSGTTEGGSSGSALFDDATKRIIGLLSGGFAACGNDDDDYYGKFSFAWLNEGTTEPSERLKDWLDPNDTGVSAIDGYGVSDIILKAGDAVRSTCDSDILYQFDLMLSDQVTNDVSLNASGAPTAVTTSFDMNPISQSGSYSLMLTGIASAAPGSYSIIVTATDGTTTADFAFQLVIENNITAEPVLLSPSDGTRVETLNPELTWIDINAASYQVEISTDMSFSTVVQTSISNTVSVSIPDLMSNTIYYWRVKGENTCGEGPASAVFRFQTSDISCRTYSSMDTPISISDGPPPNEITSVISVSDAVSISDVNVLGLEIQHTWISDLLVSIEHVETGTSALIIENACDDEFNILGDFDDAGDALECPPSGGVYVSKEPLSIFSSESSAGSWRLTVEDQFTEDGGSLESWSIEVCGSFSDLDCPPNYDLTGAQSQSQVYVSDGKISSEQIITSNAVVEYNAGNSVLLKKTFETTLDVSFHAYIDGCN